MFGRKWSERLLGLILLCMAQLGQADAALAQTGASANASARSAHVEVTLISARAAVKPGERFHVGLVQRMEPGWHTYWRNPGDSGEATRFDWTGSNAQFGPILWPAPQAIPYGPLVNYGYADQVLLPVEVTVPDTAQPGSSLTLALKAQWLECADICIPGETQVQLDVPVAATSRDSTDAGTLSTALARLPKPLPGSSALTNLGADGWQMIVKGVPLPGDQAYFFPYEIANGALIDFAKPQTIVAGKDGWGLGLAASSSPPKDLTGPVGGVLVLGTGANAQAFEVSAPIDASAAPLPAQPVSPQSGNARTARTDPGLWLALGLAFLGGLILNVMPCVFPILSMKILGLVAASQHDLGIARRHGLGYGGGVLVSFLLLAGALLVL